MVLIWKGKFLLRERAAYPGIFSKCSFFVTFPLMGLLRFGLISPASMPHGLWSQYIIFSQSLLFLLFLSSKSSIFIGIPLLWVCVIHAIYFVSFTRLLTSTQCLSSLNICQQSTTDTNEPSRRAFPPKCLVQFFFPKSLILSLLL